MKSRNIIADLHNHSTASDGEFSPAQLVSKARDIGLKAVGLTDHDSIAGLEEFIESGKKTGITVIPGAEVTLRFKRPYFTGSLHLLLYFHERFLGSTAFKKDIIHIISQGRGSALVKDRIEAINREFGPRGNNPLLEKPLTVDEILCHGENITRRHFFLALSKNHKIEDRNIIDRLIGNNSPAYIPSGIDMDLLQSFFNRYPVIKVLAHPAAGSFPGDSHYKEVFPPIEVVEQILPEFLNPDIVGIDGVEVYYPGHAEQHEEIVLQWARKHDLIITGGSDCHDDCKRPLGVAGMTEEELDRFVEKII